MKPPQLVVGAVIADSLETPTRVLAARRSGPATLAGRWEFPGGKVELGEAPQEALRRELREELSIEVELGDELVCPSATAWPINETLVMRLWFAVITDGEPIPTGSHDEVRWLKAEELVGLNWLDADRAVLPILFG